MGTLGEPLTFAGADFAAGPAGATYQFNSYRYRFRDGPRWTGWIGFTAKVRDAKIELVQGARASRK